MKAESRLRLTSKLINWGLWPTAEGCARRNVRHEPLKSTADAWFQLALVSGLRGDTETRASAKAAAEECDDYDTLMEGDFERDEAIILTKRHFFADARKALERARRLHEGDQNRLVCADGVEGRILLRQGDPVGARLVHVDAHLAWQDMGNKANPQWVLNNQLHWMFAEIMLGERVNAVHRLRVIRRDERNWIRLVTAHTAYYGGRPVCRFLLRPRTQSTIPEQTSHKILASMSVVERGAAK